ncbi:MAG: alpha/beta hydrolase, partial [Pigmentiphaga sp.]
YPPQPITSQEALAYGSECWRRGEEIEGIEFSYGDHVYQRLLVFEAEKPSGQVLLFWHGGAWMSGYKEWMSFMAPAFTASGIVFVSAGYRLAPEHRFPAGLADCANAVQWAHKNIGQYGGDPGRIIVGGHSAGGHYAALLASNCSWTQQAGVPEDVIQGCLPLSGAFDFGPGSGRSVSPIFLGQDEKNKSLASPLQRLQPPLASFLVAWGEHDFPHLIQQGQQFAAAVSKAGGRAVTLELPGRTHFSSSFAGGEVDGPWVPAALSFMKTI